MDRNRRALALFSAAAMGGSALVGASVVSSSAAAPTLTNFALSASGWSTKVAGGTLPASSAPTGVVGIGCTKYAPQSKSNNTAALNVPSSNPLVRVGATQTRASTTKTSGRVASNSVNNVGSVVLGNKATAALQINGIQTVGRAWHDSNGYHNRQVVTVAGVTRFIGGVPNRVAAIPSNQDLNGQSIRIPGVATVTFGAQSGRVTAQSANASVTGLKIELTPTGSTFFVGKASARLDGGVPAGIMGGAAWGSRLSGAGGVANSGSTAPISLPCIGTDGEWRTRELAGARIPGVATIGEVNNAVMGRQGVNNAAASGRSRIEGATFGNRNLVLRGISATANVTRSRAGAVGRFATARVLGIRVGGRAIQVPASGRTLTIPRVARIQTKVVTRTPTGISVTAVRVQLLEGSRVESTLTLGNVRLNIPRG